MSGPLISVLMPTMRAGGLDLVLNSLAAQTFMSFELVLVDALFDRRSDLVREEARDRFLRVVHVDGRGRFPLAQYCWQVNRGLAAASGEVVLFAVDYTVFPPDALAKHAEFHRLDPTGRAGLMGPHRYVELDVRPDFPRYGRGDVVAYAHDARSGRLDPFMFSAGQATERPAAPFEVDAGSTAHHDADPKLRMPAGRIEPSFCHLKNESVRLDRVLAVNGCDEALDGGHGYQDTDLAERLTKHAGVAWCLRPDLVVSIASPRHVFPFAARERSFDEQRKLFEAKRKDGHVNLTQSGLVERALMNRRGMAAQLADVDARGVAVKGYYSIDPPIEGQKYVPAEQPPPTISSPAQASTPLRVQDAIGLGSVGAETGRRNEHAHCCGSAENHERWFREKFGGVPSGTIQEAFARDVALGIADKTYPHLLRAPSAEPSPSPTPAVAAGRRLRIAMIYGEFSSAIHGPFDLDGLYTRVGLTGSESSFFNLARTLAERGHEVAVLCDCAGPYTHASGFEALPIRSLPVLAGSGEPVDAVVAWNEPDYLRYAPKGAVRIVDQQLNDWGYCRDPVWKSLVDMFVFPSRSSMDHHLRDERLFDGMPKRANGVVADVIPNSVDLALFAGPAPDRHPHRVVYCSSPDRGLHHLLGFWPEVRRRVPDAELRVFYRLAPWLERARDAPDEVGRRARYIEEALPKLARLGVSVVGLVPNAEMARELRSAAVLAYPCDPVRYTEGFGVSVLDACAAGCWPIISPADALAEVHGGAATVLPLDREKWIATIELALTASEGAKASVSRTGAEHAEAHSRERITDQWEALLWRLCGR